jgi:NAD(P)-dependent dehydrogenase (short-subunit alcohol dehydrogenase family)
MGQFATRASHAPLPLRGGADFPVHAGRSILVAGGAGGVGRAVARLLVARGARVALADVREADLRQAAGAIDGAEAFVLDLSDPSSIAAAVRAADERMGRIDGLVNCGAIVVHADPLEASWQDWERVFRVNVFGAYETARLVAKAMIAKGVKGAIVNVASEAGKKGHIDSLAYSASKAAVINMTRTLSSSLAPYDINVNCVCPGGVTTEMLREVAVAYGRLVNQPPETVFDQLISSQLQRRIEPEEVARAISFLLSDDAFLIRGQAINSDGGDTPY